MDPIYDSSSAEDIKSKRNKDKSHHDDDMSSSEEEEERSFMSKIGGFLFFGCGNGKDNKKK